MATMKLIVSVAILVIGTATLGSAHWRRENGYAYPQYYPPQQRSYQNQYPAGQTGVAVDAEWVCKNPKTGDMMVIVAEDAPAGNNGQGQWQPRQPTGQPVQPGYPGYPQPQQPNYPQPQQPNYPQPQQPNYPQQPTGPAQPTAQPPIQGTTPNAGGEGIIDIRMGQR